MPRYLWANNAEGGGLSPRLLLLLLLLLMLLLLLLLLVRKHEAKNSFKKLKEWKLIKLAD